MAFHLHSETLLPPCCRFCGDSRCVLRMRRAKAGSHSHSPFLAQMSVFVSSARGQHTSRVCKLCLLNARSGDAAGSGGPTCAAVVSSTTKTSR